MHSRRPYFSLADAAKGGLRVTGEAQADVAA